MSNPTASSGGYSDWDFLTRLRDFIEDPAVFTPQQVTSNGISTEYRLARFPVYDGDPVNLSITVNNGSTTTAQFIQPERRLVTAADNVYIDFETGWMFWAQGQPPPTGTANNIQIRCSVVRWRDRKLLDAMYAGLKAMFPRVWQMQIDTSITISINQWDYTLPPVFNDPRVVITEVELQSIPSTTERFVPIQNWRRMGNTTIQLPYSQGYDLGSIVRISYAGPYGSLGDLEPQLQHLPLWYAKGYLLSNKEIPRLNYQMASTVNDPNAQPPGANQNAATFFMRQFETELSRLARPMPVPPAIYSYNM